MRCWSTGSASADHVVERGRVAAVDQGAGAAGEHQRLAGARAGAPGDRRGELGVGAARRGGPSATRSRIASTTDSPTGMRRTSCWMVRSLVGVEHLFGARLGRAGGLEQHAPLGVAVGIDHVDLQEEAVELGLGEGIGAFLLERVLGGEHVERARQVVARRRRR